MSTPVRPEMWDAEGYPTAEILEHVRNFEGTPRELIELITALFKGGAALLELRSSSTGRKGMFFGVATLGWSGCEDVIDALHHTMFWTVFWQKSTRGGAHDFHIPTEFLDMEYRWGRPVEQTSWPLI